ncbi:hypothetical protein niasHT_006577 [Heterodera trifolii]|uniref:Uncharacterized protein n=1 Tax=Heterodera trifolii TaxID=157864 RepID=A0ABD2LXR7_9BILA
MLRFLCLASIFFSFPAVTCYHADDPIAIMKRLTTEYNLLSGPAFDVLGHLQMISERSKHLLKLTGPAGSILAACIETFVRPDDPMMRALGMLHNHIEKKFAEQTELIETAISRIRSAQDLTLYDMKATLPLSRLTDAFQDVIDPTMVRKESVKNEFKYVCTQWELRPKDVLKFINQVVNLNCHKTKDQKLVPLINAFKLLFDKFFELFSERKNLNELSTVFLQLLNSFVNLSEEQAIEKLALIEELTENVSPDTDLLDLCDDLWKIFEDTPISEPCLLRSVYEKYSSMRHPINRLAEIISIDTMKIAMIGGMCANFTFSGDEHLIKREIEKISEFVKDITGNATQWIRAELENSWPLEIIRHVKIGIKKPITDPYSFNYTANLIDDIVSSRGPFGYVSQILVTNDFDRIENFWQRCPASYCAVVKGYKGINFSLFRHKAGHLTRAHKAERWFERNRDKMYDIILKNDKTPDLGTLMRAIEMKIGPVTSPDLFHSYVIAHVSTMTAKACVVPVGLSFSQFTNYSGYSMIEAYSHYRFPTTHDERFKLFLFI